VLVGKETRNVSYALLLLKTGYDRDYLISQGRECQWGELAGEKVEKEKLYRKNLEFLELLKQGPYKKALELRKRVDELEAELADLRRGKGVLERRLATLKMSIRFRRFSRLCAALRLALEQGRVTPVFVAEELGMSTDLVHELFNELMDLGLLVRRYRGFYRAVPGLRDGGGVDLEVEVALRRVWRLWRILDLGLHYNRPFKGGRIRRDMGEGNQSLFVKDFKELVELGLLEQLT
jgi:hypothetical protein